MSQFKPFKTRRGIHHFLPVRIIESMWRFFTKSSSGIKIVLAAIICSIVGLTSPWIEIQNVGSIGAFSLMCGAIGYWISLLLVVVLIKVFSYDLTQKIQKNLHISLDSWTLFGRIGGIILLMTVIVSICLTGAARSINSDLQITADFSGLVMTIVSGVLFCLGGYVTRKYEKRTNINHLYVASLEEHDDRESYKKILGETTDENMKLPI